MERFSIFLGQFSLGFSRSQKRLSDSDSASSKTSVPVLNLKFHNLNKIYEMQRSQTFCIIYAEYYNNTPSRIQIHSNQDTARAKSSTVHENVFIVFISLF